MRHILAVGFEGASEGGASAAKDNPHLKKVLALFFQDMDGDGSGDVDFEEFKDWVAHHHWAVDMLGSTDRGLLESFQLYDTDGNGTLNKEEFVSMMTHTNILANELSSALEDKLKDFTEMVFNDIDADGSGTIEFSGATLIISHLCPLLPLSRSRV